MGMPSPFRSTVDRTSGYADVLKLALETGDTTELKAYGEACLAQLKEYEAWRVQALEVLLAQVAKKLSTSNDGKQLEYFAMLLVDLAHPNNYDEGKIHGLYMGDWMAQWCVNKILFARFAAL